jgi:NIPSNAP
MMRTLMLLAFGAAMGLLTSTALPKAESDHRVFELRTYVANPGKLDSLNARFRDHTNALFRKHGMTMVGYWVPQDEKDGKNTTLVYLLAFPDRDAARKSWAAFGADSEWQRAKADSEKDGVLVNRENVKSVFLDPTDYSPLK